MLLPLQAGRPSKGATGAWGLNCQRMAGRTVHAGRRRANMTAWQAWAAREEDSLVDLAAPHHAGHGL